MSIGKQTSLSDPAHVALVLLLLNALLFSATACGVSRAAQSSTTATLVSLSVAPNNPSILVGGTEQFTATANYSDGSTQVVTAAATWTSSDTSRATVGNSGMATGTAAGSATITAAYKGQGTSTVLTVTGTKALTSVSISPLNGSVVLDLTQQFTATATYSDGSTQVVTNSATWTSSDTSKVTVQNTGLATGLGTGVAIITATYSGQSAVTQLTVTSTTGGNTPIPLMDMTTQQNYLGFQGGLYEGASDQAPSDHNADGLTFAGQVQPLDTNGNPSSSGKIVFLAVGMSNAFLEWNGFINQASSNSGVNHTTLVIADGAKYAQVACTWYPANGTPNCGSTNNYDRVRDQVLAPIGLSEQQVQVIWLKDANFEPGVNGFQPLCDPSRAGCSNTVSTTEAIRYESQIGLILRAAKTRWPNLKLAFTSTRIYGGYATNLTNPEPYAYEYGFSAKWAIQAQINQQRALGIDPVAGDLSYTAASWVAWAPYLWADGTQPRSDGLVWCNGQAGLPCNGEVDFQSDGTHPNDTGVAKVATMLMNYFLNSPYAAWFRP